MKHKPFPGSPDDMMNAAIETMDNAIAEIEGLRARVAKLEAALKAARPHILAGSVLMQIDDALKDAPQ